MIRKTLAAGLLWAWLLPASVLAADIPLSSKSAVLYEPSSGRVLYEKDADTVRPMASTTKLMTALVAAESLPADRVVTIPEQAVLVEGSSMGLRGGDTLSVQDLLTGMLLSSGNDAANALALLTAGSLPSFAARMNAKAAVLGMTHSVFVTPSGLDEGEHGSTARDLALLGAAVLDTPALADICAQQRATVTIAGRPVTLTNHNRLLSLYEPTIGLKTGYTKKSGRCLVSAAQRDGVTLIVATLNGGDYWNDHIALYEYGFSQTESVQPDSPAVSAVPLCGGTSLVLPVRAETPPSFTLLKGETVTCEVRMPTFLWAPVTAGDTVGVCLYKRNNQVLCEVPIKATRTVAERASIGFFQQWMRQVNQLFAAALR